MKDATTLPRFSGLPTNTHHELVVQAAVRLDTDVHVGKSHAEIMDRLYDLFVSLPANDQERMEDGFVTSTGRFVSRDEAMALALKAGQLAKRAPAVLACVDGLESEALATAALCPAA